MAYIRTKTIKGKQYQYLQHSVRKGKKVKTISKYLGAIFASPLIAAAMVSENAKDKERERRSHRSTDERAKKHQEMSDRERFEKEMQNPKERFQRESTKAAAARATRDAVHPAPEPDSKMAEAVREFNEARAAEKGPQPDGTKPKL